MKIVSWNCRGKFRNKFPYIATENADIYVIQECENPQKYPQEFSNFLTNYIWFGVKDSKGLCVFAKDDLRLEDNQWPAQNLRHFISVNVENAFDLVAVWASPPYIEEYYAYQSINIDKYNNKTVIIGDFNSNAIWDKQHGKRSHSQVVSELAEKSIVSAYHHLSGEQPGFETISTFYLYGHKEKPYHIDDCFTNPANIVAFQILSDEKWLKHSDHKPILLFLKNINLKWKS